MRTYFSRLVFFPCLFALTSCGEESNSQIIKRSYEEVGDREILWSEVFDIDKEDYLVYFYSPTCGHCRSIKDQMISYASDDSHNMYLVKFSDDAVVSTSVKNTIGITSVEDLSILGTPSLIEIVMHTLTKNIAGSEAILEFLNLTSPD